MARETRATWAARVARWTSSELTAAAFAARERINPRTLTYWRWRLRADGTAALVVPEDARDTPAGVEIVLPAGYRVRLTEPVGAATLRTVLDVLEARG